MKNFIKYFGSLIVVLLGIFYIQQLVFLLYNYRQLKDIDLSLILQSFPKAFKLNWAMVSYSLLIPLLLYVVQLNLKKSFLKVFTLCFFILIAIVFFSLSTAELALYQEWGCKLNFKAFTYLENPSEVLKSASSMFATLFFIAVIIQSCFFAWLLFKLIPDNVYRPYNSIFKNIVLSFFILVLGSLCLVVGLRGGLQQIPINQSSSFYCKYNVLNLAATNTPWNAIHSVLQNKKTRNKNIYAVLKSENAIERVKKLHTPLKDTCTYFLKNNRPNVMFIILEGWAGDIVGACNGDSSITPFFNSLANKGINYERCYASGNRSDQGMAAIFSAFPAQSLTSIIEQPDKFSKLPSITSKFKNNKYYCSYYFGGQLSYANIESYMIYNQMDTLVDIKHLEGVFPQGRLGVHDEYMYQLLEKDLPKQPKPFFTSFFTGSTHAPYDIPRSTGRKWGSEMDGYSNSMIYADSCLKVFFERNQNKEWFKNTLFVLVADHSHMTHRWYDYHDALNRHIPLLLYGEVIKDELRGINIKNVVSQTDLAATLLAQLKMPYNEFKWSKNTMNPYFSHFAFYSFPSGGGWVTDQNFFSYNYSANKYELSNIKDSASEKEDLLNMKAYMQVMFQQYLDY
jgi:phosphoglycerol transferase MdoB-like AlkP superfamily enzyme